MDMQDEVDSLASHLGCAVLIEDVRHRPLWWSTEGEIDGVRAHTILRRTAPQAAASMVARLGLASAQEPVRTPALPEADMAERWCAPVRDRWQLLGYLWVLDPGGQVGEGEIPAMVACAQHAAHALVHAFPAELRVRRREILLSRLIADPDVEAAHALIDLEDLAPAAVVAVNTPATGGGWALPGDSSVHVDPPAGASYTSGRPVPLIDLSVALRRASATRRALRAGARLTAPSWDALGSWHLVVSSSSELTPGQIHPGAEVLLREPHAVILRTARSVFDNGGDVAAAAAELHVHRTTLYYRLDRIEALTGVNLRTSVDRNDLNLALRLAAYQRAG